jgi:hypothetical protein
MTENKICKSLEADELMARIKNKGSLPGMGQSARSLVEGSPTVY